MTLYSDTPSPPPGAAGLATAPPPRTSGRRSSPSTRWTRYCTVLYCTVLCCTVLYCTVLMDQVSLLTRSQSLFGLDTDAAAAPPPPAPVSRSQREIFIQLILCEYFCRYESQPQLEHAVSHEFIISHHIINF